MGDSPKYNLWAAIILCLCWGFCETQTSISVIQPIFSIQTHSTEPFAFIGTTSSVYLVDLNAQTVVASALDLSLTSLGFIQLDESTNRVCAVPSTNPAGPLNVYCLDYTLSPIPALTPLPTFTLSAVNALTIQGVIAQPNTINGEQTLYIGGESGEGSSLFRVPFSLNTTFAAELLITTMPTLSALNAVNVSGIPNIVAATQDGRLFFFDQNMIDTGVQSETAMVAATQTLTVGTQLQDLCLNPLLDQLIALDVSRQLFFVNLATMEITSFVLSNSVAPGIARAGLLASRQRLYVASEASQLVLSTIDLSPTPVESIEFFNFPSSQRAVATAQRSSGAVVLVAGNSDLIFFDVAPGCVDNTDCSNQGTCDFGDCECDDGFTLADCSGLRCPGDCTSPNNGDCDFTTGFCQCSRSFTGDDCALAQCPGGNLCSNQGTCNLATFECICDAGFGGDDCSQQNEPCSFHTSCSSCLANSSCGWCESTSVCQLGGVDGPENGSCLSWNYDSCPQLGLEVFGYLFSFIAFLMLAVDFFSLVHEDATFSSPLGEDEIRRSWWRNQRSAKTWQLIDQIQVVALTTQLAVSVPTSYATFAMVFRWAVLAFPLPWNSNVAQQDRDQELVPAANATGGNSFSAFGQYHTFTGTPENVSLWALLWWILIFCILLAGIFAVIGLAALCTNSERVKEFAAHRTAYFYLRLYLVMYLPLASLCLYPFYIASDAVGEVVIGVIIFILYHLLVPIAIGWYLNPFEYERSRKAKLFGSKILKKLGPVYNSYYLRKQWFFYIALGRRLLLGVLLAVVQGSEIAQLVLISLIFLAYLVALLLTKPYLDRIHLYLDVSITVINFVCTILCFAFISQVNSELTRNTIGFFVGALYIVAMVFCVAAFFSSWIRLKQIKTWKQLFAFMFLCKEPTEVEPNEKVSEMIDLGLGSSIHDDEQEREISVELTAKEH